MNHSELPLIVIAARTTIVLVALGLGLRFLNKRHVGEMRLHDILLVLLASNAVQNAMAAGSGRLLVSIVAAATLISIGWVVAVVFDWSPFLEKHLTATPVVLVHEGTVLRRNLRRGRLSEEELAEAVRKQGILRVGDVKLAVLETNGSISIVPKEHEGRTQ